jgi:folate-binding protein YgfZ
MLIALRHRQLVRFCKTEAEDFLNDLITATIPITISDGLRPAALLTPQGRILYDLLISRDDGGDILVELDAARAESFIKKMTMYRMRRDVMITADDCPVFAGFDLESSHVGIVRDTRFEDAVYRVYGDTTNSDRTDNADLWTAYRYQHGVAEGIIDLPPEKALPLEARLDLNEGISFEKGCYIGQEVTARTRYRGLVKRSYLPVSLPSQVQVPQDITAGGKVVGEVLGAVTINDRGLGLASIRLDALDTGTELSIKEGIITPQYPARLMPLPEVSKK